MLTMSHERENTFRVEVEPLEEVHGARVAAALHVEAASARERAAHPEDALVSRPAELVERGAHELCENPSLYHPL